MKKLFIPLCLIIILLISCSNDLNSDAELTANDIKIMRYIDALEEASANGQTEVTFFIDDLPDDLKAKCQDDSDGKVTLRIYEPDNPDDATSRITYWCFSRTQETSHINCSGVSWGYPSTRIVNAGSGNCSQHGAYNYSKYQYATYDCKNCNAWKTRTDKAHWN